MMKSSVFLHLLLGPFSMVVALLPCHSTAFQFQLTTKPITRVQAVTNTALSVSSSLLPEETYSAPKKEGATTTCPAVDSQVQLLSYEHDGYTMQYRYKPAAPGMEAEPPLLLVHPVGIGLASWFWDEMLDEWNDTGAAVYAPDLIGCGIDQGSDAWKPEEKGMFFPLSWVKGCETLLQSVILPQARSRISNNNSNSLLASLLGNTKKTGNSNNKDNANNNKVTVVTQGGLAPVGVMLAHRNPETVAQLVMASPPTWDDMTVPIPAAELEKNYKFLTSKLGDAAFGALESEWAIRFFSNLFLFEDKADPKWVQQCLLECQYETARPPIQAFNAGLMQHRSYLDELTSLPVPTTIVQGKVDVNRNPARENYATEMKDCTMVTLPAGLNVLPWECPALFAEALQATRNV